MRSICMRAYVIMALNKLTWRMISISYNLIFIRSFILINNFNGFDASVLLFHSRSRDNAAMVIDIISSSELSNQHHFRLQL
jgi:hypothetical protein